MITFSHATMIKEMLLKSRLFQEKITALEPMGGRVGDE
jgi:hypothetical protein